MARKFFKDMTIAELKEIAAEEGKKCSDAEREYLEEVARRPHDGMAFRYAKLHWETGNRLWSENMSNFLRALRRVFDREVKEHREHETRYNSPARYKKYFKNRH